MTIGKFYERTIERLSHFKCCLCQSWWAIGDAPKRDLWFCPWCGSQLSTADSIVENDDDKVEVIESNQE